MQNTDSNINAIGNPGGKDDERRIAQLTGKMTGLGPMLPGSISEQWNVCGTPGCRCKKPDLPEARRRLMRYRQFKRLSTELVQAHIAVPRTTEFTRRPA